MISTHVMKLRTLALVGLVAAACDPTDAPSSAYQASAPVWAAPVVDGGQDAGAKDAGTDAGTGGTDAGTSDGGTAVPGLSIVSSNNRLPKPWDVTDATQLFHTQPLDAGVLTAALKRVGQVVRLNVSTTNDNTVLDDDHCPNIFSGTCDGFAAKDSANHLVLVDSFALLGSSMNDCAAKFNATTLPQISGVWAGRLLSATMTTTYSITLSSCAGVGVGTAYTGSPYAPASTDIQDMQVHYPVGSVVTVHGVVTGVQTATTPKTIFIQDPGGGEWSGIQVFATSGYPTQPKVGDYVTVTATASARGDYNQLVLP